MLVCTMGIFSGCNKNDDKKPFELAGKWNVKEMPMDIVWEAPDNVVIEAGKIKLTVKQLTAMMTPTLNELVQAGLKDVTFTADGKIEATYKKKDSKEWMAAKGYATYNTKVANKILLHPDADKVFAEMKGLDATKLAAIKVLFKAGIPVIPRTVPLPASISTRKRLRHYAMCCLSCWHRSKVFRTMRSLL